LALCLLVLFCLLTRAEDARTVDEATTVEDYW